MPLIDPNGIGQRDARKPAGRFEFRSLKEMRDMNHAKISNPEVLHAANGAIEVHSWLMSPANDNGAGSASIAGGANADGRLDNTL